MHYLKRYFKAFYMSVGMFSAIPLPFHIWDDGCVSLILSCFPLVGVLIGAIWLVVARVVSITAMHIMPVSAILAILPFILSGFLHLDGYMDTSDAVLSRRPFEDKLRILKDPHVGAFAAIMLAVLFMLQFSAMYAVLDYGKNLILIPVIFVISRCCSSLAILRLKPMGQSGYANMFKKSTGISHVIFTVLIISMTFFAAYLIAGLSGITVATFTALGFSAAMVYTYKEFKGISGDLTGFSLIIGELCGLITLAAN